LRISVAEIFEALGFRFAPAENSTMANPIGLDGIFHAHCPPYFSSMDDAVDAVLTPLLRTPQARSSPAPDAIPYLISDTQHWDNTVAVSDDGIACTKAICNYIYETYGRFPGGSDAMHLMWVMQAHHLDTDFYDRFYRPGAYGPTHAAHQDTWHP
jgi:hypothetical protein